MADIAIIGGGISGLSLAYFLKQKSPEAEVLVFESDRQPGGKIWTDRAEGFLCEGGVNGFLDNRPKTLELAASLTLQPLRSNDAARKRFVFSDGTLHRLPESPPAFLSSRLLSLRGRLRVMAEAVVPRAEKEEESLAGFARRRLGREAYEKLIDPMASGIYAGNAETLSLRSCFPKVYDLEAKYGSLIRGMISLQRQKKRSGSSEKVGAGPGGVLTSFYNGMGEMIGSLAGALGSSLRTGARAVALERRSDGYTVFFSDGSKTDAATVVLASPAYAASEILRNLDKTLSSAVGAILYPALSVVCFGYRKDRISAPLDGFGYLVPSREKRKILGTLWDSSIFPNRAPEGYVLLRTMVGGARASALALEPDGAVADMVRREVADIMGIAVSPDFQRIYRHELAIPQYTLGHRGRLDEIDALLARHRGLYLTGNAYRGIGVNDCIENSSILAEKIIEESF